MTRVREIAPKRPEPYSLKAARAFINEDYKAVIYWLRPHLADLSPIDSKKLLISVANFTEGFVPEKLKKPLYSRIEKICYCPIKAEIDAKIENLGVFARNPSLQGIGVYIGSTSESPLHGREILDMIVSHFDALYHYFPIAYCLNEDAREAELKFYIRDQIVKIDPLNILDSLDDIRHIYMDLWGIAISGE